MKYAIKSMITVFAILSLTGCAAVVIGAYAVTAGKVISDVTSEKKVPPPPGPNNAQAWFCALAPTVGNCDEINLEVAAIEKAWEIKQAKKKEEYDTDVRELQVIKEGLRLKRDAAVNNSDAPGQL